MIILTDELKFPDPQLANREGLLAIGGDLKPEWLLLAYRSGIFPWFSDGGIIHWFCPAHRFVLFPDEIKISHSLRQILNSKKFGVTEDKEFEAVIHSCAQVHTYTKGNTWIDDDFISAYIKMHELGHAHSLEVWDHETLVGGLYGIVIGPQDSSQKKIFCGESMFSVESNASKVALVHLCRSKKYEMIDCQIYTEHLEKMGAKLIPREKFLMLVSKNVASDSRDI
ncbi:MAG TPA: leucyl/phenylalanyl-tRNA--protein transferase [Chitinophagales bacterium]|nr:leucyl/phenylalanyl-tRNA--protein transferase [Chitinophagales bacterium]